MLDAPRTVLLGLSVALTLALDLGRVGGQRWWPLYVLPLIVSILARQPATARGLAALSVALTLTATGLSGPASVWAWTVPVIALAGASAVVLQLHRSIERLRGEADHHAVVLDLAGVLVVELDRRGRVILVNETAARLLARPRREIIGADWFATFVPDSWRNEVQQVHRRLVEGNEPQDYVHPVITPTGGEQIVAWHNSVVRDTQGRVQGTLSSGRDLTEQRATEEALRRSRKELEDLKYAIDQADIVAATDQRGTITYANDKFCDISKYTREELIGQDHRIINSGYHSKEYIREMWRTIANGGVWRGELRNRAKDGTFYWVDTTIVPFLDDRGKPYQYMALRSDITERKRAEELLREQAALTRLGELAAVVAHEVRNPIAGAQGALQIIRGRLPENGQDRAIVDEIMTRFEGLNRLIEDILVYARPRPLRLAPTTIRAVLDSVATFVGGDAANRDVRLNVTHEADPMPLLVDVELVKAVFLNLVQNAIQAMNGHGVVDIQVNSPAERCVVTVRDHGPGIPVDHRERVFEPFFTTRHRGTGLGLAIAKRVVERHGGSIGLDCPADGGTVVTVSLPRAFSSEQRNAPMGTTEPTRSL